MNKNQRQLTVKEMLDSDGIKVSIYMPTHRAYPDNRKDPIVYKNLLQDIEKDLSQKHARREWEGLFASLSSLMDDTDFWNHTLDGLGVLAVGDRMERFVLEQTMAQSYTIGCAFNLLPLFSLTEISERALLAAISKDRVRVFTIDAKKIVEIDPPNIKSSFPELFDDYDNNSTLRTGSYRGLGGAYHGQGGSSRQTDIDSEKYFRYLDSRFQKIHDNTGLPVILAGTEGTIAEFTKLAKGAFYLEDPITKPVDSINAKDLQSSLQDVMQPYSQSRLENLNTFISNKRNENKAASKPADIHQAAMKGNVEMLILSQELARTPEETLMKAAEDTIRFGGILITADKSELAIKEKSLALLRSNS